MMKKSAAARKRFFSLQPAWLVLAAKAAGWYAALALVPALQPEAPALGVPLISLLIACLAALAGKALRTLAGASVVFSAGAVFVLVEVGAYFAAAGLVAAWGWTLALTPVVAIGAAALTVNTIGLAAASASSTLAKKAWQLENDHWTAELEQGSDWLQEQASHWRGVALERQRLVEEQAAWIEQLREACEWHRQQAAHWQGQTQAFQFAKAGGAANQPSDEVSDDD